MKTKRFKSFSDLVYSTDPEAVKPQEAEENACSMPPAEQKLLVTLDRKQRRGKTVTIVAGFEGGAEELKSLGKRLKVKCGVGGSVKDGQIILQGDYRATVLQWLKTWGYGLAR